jgi:cytochrome P450
MERTTGGAVTDETPSLAELEENPYPALARLRARAPVAWVPALGGWLVTSYAHAVEVMKDARTFTVDDPRFSTARVVGPSMLSLDGRPHTRHRAPFAGAFHHGRGGARLAGFAGAEATRLVAAIRDRGAAEIRRDVSGPLAVSVVAEALGLGHVAAETILSIYSRIMGGVTGLSGDQAPARAGQETAPSAGQPPADVDPGAAAAFTDLAARLRAVIGTGHQSGARPGDGGRPGDGQEGAGSVLAEAAGGGQLTTAEAISDAAVIMFGGIDTTDGMIANAVLHLLGHPDQLDLVRADPALVPAAVEESVRLEPAAAIVDRYATADSGIGGASIRAGDRVTVSLTAANRDPAVFAGPDRFDLRRAESGRHLSFAHGPHFCIGAALARAETRAAVRTLLATLPGLRLAEPAAPRGLVFRKPPSLHVTWDP